MIARRLSSSSSSSPPLVRHLQTGLVGLPNVGKSTLFNALVQSNQAAAANYPFCTIEPNTGQVPVPDGRLTRLAEMYSTQREVPTTLEFVDIAGLVVGASEGAGLGNKFLSNIRSVDAILHVLRAFAPDDPNSLVHVEGRVDPVADADLINMELALADLSQIDRRLEKLKGGRNKLSGTAAQQADLEADVLAALHSKLDEGIGARRAGFDEEQLGAIKHLGLLTAKPVVYVANVGDEAEAEAGGGQSGRLVQELVEFAAGEGAPVVAIAGQAEADLSEFQDPEEREEMRMALGITTRTACSSTRCTGGITCLCSTRRRSLSKVCRSQILLTHRCPS